MTESEIILKLFRADERSVTQTSEYQIIQTFFASESVLDNFGEILVVNDITLKEAFNLRQLAQQNSKIIQIPITGGINTKSLKEGEQFVSPGELRVFQTRHNTEYKVLNPYQYELVNYLELVFSSSVISRNIQLKFDLESSINKLIPIIDEGSNNVPLLKLNIGKFEETQEVIYKATGGRLMIFVIEGSLQLEKESLNSRDSAIVTDVEKIEFKIFSKHATVVIVDFDTYKL